MKNVVMKMVVMSAILGLLVAACPTMATVTTLFYDGISGYAVSDPVYPHHNAEVVQTQDSGCAPWLQTTDGWFGESDLVAPNQSVYLGSGSMYNYSTIAVNKSTTARYGQVMVRVACQDWDDGPEPALIRMGIFGVADATFAAGPDAPSANAGVELQWFPGRLEELIPARTTMTSLLAGYQNVTINYDLLLDKFDVWYGTEKVGNGASFATALTSVESIAIGGARWVTNCGGALDSWQWQVSGDTAFTSYATQIPEPTTLIILGLGAAVSFLRRRVAKA